MTIAGRIVLAFNIARYLRLSVIGEAHPRPGSIRIEHEPSPDLADRAHSAQPHRGMQLLLDDLQGARHAGLAHGAETEVERAADQGAFRPEGKRLEQVLARADA